jgi:predicted phosphoribosyltransferase
MATPLTSFRLPFRDRCEAGQLLASRLQSYDNRPDVLVFALPRGGVPVAAEIAKALNLPLSVLVVRKLGVPGQEELAMGAVTNGGMVYINRAITGELGLSESLIETVVHRETQEVARRESLYNRGKPMPDVKGKTVILVDDGVATGASMFLAAQALHDQGATEVILAIPVAPPQTVRELNQVADQIVCLAQPSPFFSVGLWYNDFHQLTDEEVCQTLDHLLPKSPEMKPAS